MKCNFKGRRSSMKEIINSIIKFRDERNWKQFHTGANLAKSLSIEAAEVLQLFQWNEECKNVDDLKDEVADVMIYALLLCEKYNMDPEAIISAKLRKNSNNYPVEKAFSSSKKYTEF